MDVPLWKLWCSLPIRGVHHWPRALGRLQRLVPSIPYLSGKRTTARRDKNKSWYATQNKGYWWDMADMHKASSITLSTWPQALWKAQPKQRIGREHAMDNWEYSLNSSIADQEWMQIDNGSTPEFPMQASGYIWMTKIRRNCLSNTRTVSSDSTPQIANIVCLLRLFYFFFSGWRLCLENTMERTQSKQGAFQTHLCERSTPDTSKVSALVLSHFFGGSSCGRLPLSTCKFQWGTFCNSGWQLVLEGTRAQRDSSSQIAPTGFLASTDLRNLTSIWDFLVSWTARHRRLSHWLLPANAIQHWISMNRPSLATASTNQWMRQDDHDAWTVVRQICCWSLSMSSSVLGHIWCHGHVLVVSVSSA